MVSNCRRVSKRMGESGINGVGIHQTLINDEMPNANLGRILNSVPYPETRILMKSEVFDKFDKPRIHVLKEHFFREGKIDRESAIHIIKKATELFKNEPNVVQLQSPVTICGDIHGQYYDLMKLFEVGGAPHSTQYLFLGDYVDRGQFGIECLLYLYSIKICYSDTFYMLRGNHECRHLTSYFTFKEECDMKYGPFLYDICTESFKALPLAAVVNKQFLCVHGGLSPDILSIDDILEINRFCEPPSRGPHCDLLWADPMEDYGSDSERNAFVPNLNRGCSYFYSYSAVIEFITMNNLLCVIRAHEAQDVGYKMYRKSPKTGFPSLITLFSAPNYLDVYNNKAAILKYENNTVNIKQFNSSPHPYWLPNFMNVFTWSLPFVAEKLTHMLMVMLNVCSEEELMTEEQTSSLTERKAAIKAKILAIGSLASTYTAIRRINEEVVSLKGLTPPRTPDPNTIMKLHDSLTKGKEDNTFDVVKNLDKVNERMPPKLTENEVKKCEADNTFKTMSLFAQSQVKKKNGPNRDNGKMSLISVFSHDLFKKVTKRSKL